MRVMFFYTQDAFMTKEKMPPLGLAYMATVLREHGHEVEIIDNQLELLSPGGAAKKVAAFSPDVVGMNCLTGSRFLTFEIADAIKKEIPNTVIVMGGHHVAFTTEDTLNNIKSVDYIVRGEGEQIMLDLVNALEKSKNLKHELKGIAGISYRGEDGKVIDNPYRPPMDNITGLWPARDLLRIEDYNIRLYKLGVEATSMFSTRGCPIGCVYCSVTAFSGPYYRVREAKDVVDEMEFLRGEYGMKRIFFWDSFFTGNRKRTTDVCEEMIRRRVDMPWFCEIRAGSVDRSTLELMRRAGCYYVAYGIETGSERVMKIINKKITHQQVKEVAQWCKELDIITRCFFMMNHPGETVQEALETIKLKKEHYCTWSSIGPTAIYPGTAVEKYAKEHGYFPKDFSWSKPFYDPDLKMFDLNPHVPLFEQPGFTKKEVWKLMLEGRKDEPLFKKFKGVTNRLKFVRSFRDLKALAKVSAEGFNSYILKRGVSG